MTQTTTPDQTTWICTPIQLTGRTTRTSQVTYLMVTQRCSGSAVRRNLGG